LILIGGFCNDYKTPSNIYQLKDILTENAIREFTEETGRSIDRSRVHNYVYINSSQGFACVYYYANHDEAQSFLDVSEVKEKMKEITSTQWINTHDAIKIFDECNKRTNKNYLESNYHGFMYYISVLPERYETKQWKLRGEARIFKRDMKQKGMTSEEIDEVITTPSHKLHPLFIDYLKQHIINRSRTGWFYHCISQLL